RPLIEAAAGEARAVLVVEPAPAIETVITARRGIGRYVLRVFGRAAHAGSDREAGINAAVELSAKILALARADARAKGYAITVGTIAGGVRPNIVPEYAQAEIDLRLIEPGRIAAAEAALRKAAAVSRVSGARYSLEGGLTRPPMPETSGNRWLFALAAEEARDLGLELQPFSSGGGSDGNFCAAIGTPVLDGLGPAGAGAHAEHEHILVSSLAPRLSLLHALGRRLGESGGPVGQGEGSA
ncbi:MAG: M20/M25/M40 family metallo-hydrolase, partial [Bacteroidota bacterium]